MPLKTIHYKSTLHLQTKVLKVIKEIRTSALTWTDEFGVGIFEGRERVDVEEKGSRDGKQSGTKLFPMALKQTDGMVRWIKAGCHHWTKWVLNLWKILPREMYKKKRPQDGALRHTWSDG